MTFNATVIGQPYTRFNRIGITYPQVNTAHIEVISQEYVLLTDNTRVPIGGETSSTFEVLPTDMGTEIPLVSPDTGEPLGANMSYGQIMLGILAAIHAHQ